MNGLKKISFEQKINNNIDNGMDGMEKQKLTSSGFSEAITTRERSLEQQEKEVMTHLICTKFHY